MTESEGPEQPDTRPEKAAGNTEGAGDSPLSAQDSDGWRPTPMWYTAEIIVVVIGVIIALAANAWWESRREAALEDEVRRSVRVELEQNRSELRAVLAETENCLERMDGFLRRTPGSLAAVPADSAFYWVTALSCRRTFEPAFGAARTLAGAGGFHSVEALHVRAAVAAWVAALDDATEEKVAMSAHADRVYQALSSYAAAASGSGLPGFPTLPRLVAQSGPAVVADLRRDTAVIRASLRRAHYQRAYGQELSEALAAADKALALLADTKN